MKLAARGRDSARATEGRTVLPRDPAEGSPRRIHNYAEGVLPVKTKELLGLVASMVLRCDDCIKYHLLKCHEQKCTTEEIYEVFAVANIVGGTIVIPHTRRAAEYWEALQNN